MLLMTSPQEENSKTATAASAITVAGAFFTRMISSSIPG
jgi:hypothetical protein